MAEIKKINIGGTEYDIHAAKLTTARTIALNGAVSGSTTFDGSRNVSIATTNGQHISNKASGTCYYKLGTMVTDDSGNHGNITISGRLGGWEQSNSANFDIMMLNRSSARDGNTITATVSASGQVEQALSKCDIVVYKQDDTSEIVYLKLSGYWLYDFDWSVYQHSINYSATNVTPTGTLVWSLSSAPKTILDASGTLHATKFVGSFEGTMENATKATQDASGNVITDTYMTKVNPTGSGVVSFGRKSGTTIGTSSIAIGENSTASEDNTVAIGASASATNKYAVAIGSHATASGEQSTAIGTAPTASGKQSTALGVHTTAAGEYSTSMGCWTSSNGIAGTSLGNGSTVDANSWAAVSSGVVTVARGMGQHVFGAYNIPDAEVDSYSTPAEHLLIVGNGDSSAKSNAMTVDWDGNAWFSGDAYVGSTSGTNKDSGSKKLATQDMGIFYIEGDSASTTDTTNKVATWIGSHPDIAKYFSGLTILYKVVTAGSTTTTLNINNLGAVTVVRNATTGISTACPVDGVLLLTYTVDSSGTAYWKTADYDANTKNTAGTSNKTSTKMYLVGGTSQSSSGVTTYSNKNVYIGTDDGLYAYNSTAAAVEKVLTTTDLESAIGTAIAASY